MSKVIDACWDFERIGAFSIEITDPGGTETISLTAGAYHHVDTDISAVSSNTTGIVAFFSDLQTAINAAPSLTRVYTVTFSDSTLAYTIAANGTFSLTAPTGVAAQVLGRTTAASSVTSLSSNVRPYYVIATEHDPSSVSDDYEPDGIVEGGYTTGGGHFAIAAASGITFHDLTFPHEQKAAVFERHATAAVPWTYEHLFKHNRSTEPFIVWDATANTGSVHFMRPEAARFKPSRVVADWDERWSLELKTYLEGRV